MNGSSIQPERAWQMTLDQLRLDMPKASFDTWVRDTSFVSFEAGIFSIGTPNSYGREWLGSRLTSTVTRLLTGIMNQHVEIQFVVIEEEPEIEQDGLPEDEDHTQDKHPSVLTLQAEYQSIYDEIVQPDQVIVVPGYFLRYIPLLGLELAWLYIGFRQAAYEAGAAKNPGKKFGAPSKKVARYSGMSMRTFWRWVGKPDTWKRLRGLVTQVETEARWSRGKDGRPHQSARSYRVAMSLQLTPFDEHSLRAWLYRQLAQGKTALSVLQTALETPVEELIPWPEKIASFEGAPDEPHTIQDVLFAVCGSVPESQKGQFHELADKLAHHLMPPKDLIFLTHYFVTHWLPKLGSGPGWFVTVLRDEQQHAAAALYQHEMGILAASTAFGKTVVAAYLIAQRQVNTLVIVHRRQLLDQWFQVLYQFLGLSPKEIGQIGGGKQNPNGQLDVTMVQSLSQDGVVNDIVGNYGYLVVDECHHISAVSFEQVVRQCKAKYITGLSATVTRKDGHHPIIFMQCGPVRYKVSDRSQAEKRPFDHKVIVRPTNFRLPSHLQNSTAQSIQEVYTLLAKDDLRNRMIVDDVVAAVQTHRFPVL